MRTSPPAGQASSGFVRWLPFLFAAGAVFWLVQITQAAAMVAAPVGRDRLAQTLANAGITHDVTAVLTAYLALIFAFEAIAAGLHGAAYYGLRRKRPWGWIVAVLVAGAWSLVIVGIPVFVFLLQRKTREAYGVR
ncbi:MAG TPA: hypothetical protein VGE99_02055 [Candidatus Dormibacteraeota bacterium]